LHQAADVDERVPNVLEKDEQAYIAKLFRGFGCKVYNLSQARASKQTPGLPDLWVVNGAIVEIRARSDHSIAFWFEVKRAHRRPNLNAQRGLRSRVRAASVRHYVGDRRIAAKLLVDIGLARVGEGPCGIVPFHPPITPLP
jgi:hypothetical protein